MSERATYRGICIPLSRVLSRPYSDEDYQKFKRWNFNSVQYYTYWGSTESYGGIEPWEDQPGVYNESALKAFEAQFALARKYGLYPFLGIRVSLSQLSPPKPYVGWSDPYGGDIVNMNNSGRVRYCNMLRMLASRFPNVGINTWHFPYHAQTSLANDPARINTYYTITQPAFYMAIRIVSNAPIILTCMLQGVKHSSGMGALEDQPYYPDRNVYYGVNTKSILYGNLVMNCYEWDYDYEAMNAYYQPVVDFKKKHPAAKIICAENIALNTHNACPERPIKQSRLDWMKASLEKQRELDMSWFYWRYENPSTNDGPLEGSQAYYGPPGSDTPITALLAEYAPTPIPPLMSLAWLTSGLAPIITVGSVVAVQELKKIGIIP